MGADIFYREHPARDFTEQHRRVAEPELAMQRAQARRLRALSYDANLGRRGFARGGWRRRATGRSSACAGTSARPTARWAGRAHAARPRRSVAASRRDRSARGRRPASRSECRRRRGRPRRSTGSARTPGRRARVLRRSQRACTPSSAAHHAPLVPKLVGDDPLQHHDEASAAPARPEKSVEVDADRDVGDRRRERDPRVVEPAVERVKAGADVERPHGGLVAEHQLRPRTRPSMATNVPLPSVGDSGVDVRNSKRTTRALAPGEPGRALLQEGPRAFLSSRRSRSPRPRRSRSFLRRSSVSPSGTTRSSPWRRSPTAARCRRPCADSRRCRARARPPAAAAG